MKIVPNEIYKNLFTGNSRYYICIGGRSAGRSYAASQFALLHLLADEYFRCAIMRFILGDIRNSIFQEIRDRIEENELEDTIDIRDNTLSFSIGNNKINGIGFRKSSSDQKSKLKSLASYNCVIIEEADEVSEEDFLQLDDSLRTIKSDIKVILLTNPPHKNHWIVKRWFNLENSNVEGFYNLRLKESETDATFIHGTYKDNITNLNQKTIDNFKKYKDRNREHYYSMIEGMVSEGVIGRIFKDIKAISVADFEALPYESYYGLDFGFSNDPAALIEIKSHNDTIWTRELLYETGLTNSGPNDNTIDYHLNRLGVDPSAPIYADSAEPKSIRELQEAGWNVLPAQKGKDSIKFGIDTLLGKKIYCTEDSKNFWEETENYVWALDKNKNPTNKPVDDFNHLWDGFRYGYITHRGEFVGFV